MAMQPVASVVLLKQRLPEQSIAAVRLVIKKARLVAVLALGIALVPLPPRAAFGQTNSQQEEQQREQQQRDEQQREQQQRDQQQRDEQQREQQQREEQQRQQEQQQREQQQREEQQREQEQRDQQQREQQQREEQQREQEQRDQQQREAQEQQQRDQELKAQQQREQQARDQQQRTSDSPVPSSKPGAEVSRTTDTTPAADVKRPTSDIQAAGAEHKPYTSLPIKPAPQPIAPKAVPEVAKETCKDGSCPPCSSTQAKDKKNSPCAPEAAAKNVAPAAPKNVGPQSCDAGQVWNGNQCLTAGTQPCTPGQVGIGCQVKCTTAVGGAQNLILQLRSARQERDAACLKNPSSRECLQADADYEMSLILYRNYLGGVPPGCQSTLPDPSAL